MSNSLKRIKHKRSRKERLSDRRNWLQQELQRVEDELEHADDNGQVFELGLEPTPTVPSQSLRGKVVGFFERARGWLSKLPMLFRLLLGTARVSTIAAWSVAKQVIVPVVRRTYESVRVYLENIDVVLDRAADRFDMYVERFAEALGFQIARAILHFRYLSHIVKSTIESQLAPTVVTEAQPQPTPVSAAA
jgi:hypothetical protein